MRYVKYRKEYPYKDLKNDIEFRKKYFKTLVYSSSFPYTFYCWFVDRNYILFFKRSQIICDDMLVKSVSIKLDTAKTAKNIARILTIKDIRRVFNDYKSITL